ncbi:MAG: DUF488 domain-containing protein [Candidatus Omnitrophica bacterium]|nr:DUF488 domain-containing protein [Candidatus Omnitrophota bacterium]
MPKLMGSRLAQAGIIFTIGHSTHNINEFVRMLKNFCIEELVDVRTIPHSRKNKQFDIKTLPVVLKKNKISYIHLPQLGGFRRVTKDSINSGWRNLSFRGFADYMQTAAFKEALTGLIIMLKEKNIALMCAESLPWRCHRSLIADALSIRGICVAHIMGLNQCKLHTLTPFAKVRGFNLSYPA